MSTHIIDHMIATIDDLRRHLGDGTPDTGERITPAIRLLKAASHQLQSVIPDLYRHWAGLAANRYADQHQKQVDLLNELGALNRECQILIASQATMVEDARRHLTELRNLLHQNLRPAAESITMSSGQVESDKFQTEACAAAMTRVQEVLKSVNTTTEHNTSQALIAQAKLGRLVGAPAAGAGAPTTGMAKKALDAAGKAFKAGAPAAISGAPDACSQLAQVTGAVLQTVISAAGAAGGSAGAVGVSAAALGLPNNGDETPDEDETSGGDKASADAVVPVDALVPEKDAVVPEKDANTTGAEPGTVGGTGAVPITYNADTETGMNVHLIGPRQSARRDSANENNEDTSEDDIIVDIDDQVWQLV